tara:strand:+ start:51 stop:557 length:507 start_codon:yes stop_codon:yes gene_type:complete
MNYNCNNVSVTFPLTITEASYTNVLTGSILGSSYMIFKPYCSEQTVLFKSKTAIVDVDGAAQARATDYLENNNYFSNIIKGRLTNNYIKIHINGILATSQNTVCVNDYLVLHIPETSDSEIMYQSYLTFPNLQGTFICNYTYYDNSFTIQTMYFYITRNGYFNINFKQ